MNTSNTAHVIRGGVFVDTERVLFSAIQQERFCSAIAKLHGYLGISEDVTTVTWILMSGKRLKGNGILFRNSDKDWRAQPFFRVRWLPYLQPGYRRMTFEELMTFYGVRFSE